MAQIAVIIVGWNSWDVLPRCLAGLAAQTYTDFSVTLIDNASSQPIPAELRVVHPYLKVVRSPINLGFATANNLAVAQHSGSTEWIALLNPDAFPEPEWLKELIEATESHPNYSVFASRQLCADQPSLLDGDGDAYHISGRPWRNGHGKPVVEASQLVREVFGPCGASAVYRRSIFIEQGGFDEDFFCFVEDVDLSFRLQLAGHACLLIPQAIVHHQGASSTGSAHSDFAVYYGHRNLVWAYFKNMPGWLLWATLPLHMGLTLLSVLRYLHRPRVIWRAKRDALSSMGRIWRRRQIVQAKRKTTVAALLRQLTLLHF